MESNTKRKLAGTKLARFKRVNQARTGFIAALNAKTALGINPNIFNGFKHRSYQKCSIENSWVLTGHSFMLSWDLNFWHFEGGLSELSIARTD